MVALGEKGAQTSWGGVGEDVAVGKAYPLLSRFCHELHGHERCAAQKEEVVGGGNILLAKQFAEECA